MKRMVALNSRTCQTTDKRVGMYVCMYVCMYVGR